MTAEDDNWDWADMDSPSPQEDWSDMDTRHYKEGYDSSQLEVIQDKVNNLTSNLASYTELPYDMVASQKEIEAQLQELNDDWGPVQRPPSPREVVLDLARNAVMKQRNNTYGPPSQDFTRTAALWTVLFGEKLAEGEEFNAENVAQALILLKMSRSVWSPEHLDNWVDVAGYAACGYEAYEERVNE